MVDSLPVKRSEYACTFFSHLTLKVLFFKEIRNSIKGKLVRGERLNLSTTLISCPITIGCIYLPTKNLCFYKRTGCRNFNHGIILG